MKNKLNLIIRKAKISDLQNIQALGTGLMKSDRRFDPTLIEEWYFSSDAMKYLLNRIRGKKGVCLVAEVNKQLVGYLTGKLLKTETWRPFYRAEVNNLYIETKYQSKGIGAALLKAFIEWSKANSAERIVLNVESKNVEAIRFYQKNNFNPARLEMEAKI
ncbi:MAG: GNAT family N-acetyltransferase [Candidatus Daviesbacteria bacterium]|nr:GNAT family N-acetyltransferase [Candidatus Daviesbacteria bacterium]